MAFLLNKSYFISHIMTFHDRWAKICPLKYLVKRLFICMQSGGMKQFSEFLIENNRAVLCESTPSVCRNQ